MSPERPATEQVPHPRDVERQPTESPQKTSSPHPKPTTRPLRRVAKGLRRRRVETEVDDQGLYAVKCFLRDCRATALSRLERGEMSETAGFYIRETMVLMAEVVHDLVVAGDLCLARSLSAVATHYERALGVYGNRICGQFGEMPKIDAILQKHKARELMAMASSHEPDWDAVLCAVTISFHQCCQP